MIVLLEVEFVLLESEAWYFEVEDHDLEFFEEDGEVDPQFRFQDRNQFLRGSYEINAVDSTLQTDLASDLMEVEKPF